jgi:hypothetical protein
MHPTDLVALLATVPAATPHGEAHPAAEQDNADLLARLGAGELTTTEVLSPAISEHLQKALARVLQQGLTPISQEGALLCKRLRSLPPTSAACAW